MPYSSVSIYNPVLFVLLPWHYTARETALKTNTVLHKQQFCNSLQKAFAAASYSQEKSFAFWALAFAFLCFLNPVIHCILTEEQE